MEIDITAKGIELSPQAQKHIKSKMGKILRHLSGVMSAQLELEEQKTKSPDHQFIADAAIEASTAIVRGRARGDNLLTAVDRLVDVLDRQIAKAKGRRHDKEKAAPAASDREDRQLSENYAVRVRHMPVKEMSVEKAISKMESLHYDFYLFLSADTKKPRVLYRRIDGGYGLVEPEYQEK